MFNGIRGIDTFYQGKASNGKAFNRWIAWQKFRKYRSKHRVGRETIATTLGMIAGLILAFMAGVLMALK